MRVLKTSIKDLLIIEPNVFGDSRGWFSETYNEKAFKDNGINIIFKQDNHSYSKLKGIRSGLDCRTEPYAQTNLVRCTKGKIWDVAVDLRKNSTTYLKWIGMELSSENHKIFLIPQGFAHGFITLEEDCEVQYKVDNMYSSNFDRAIKYNDPELNILWPLMDVLLSEKDLNAPFLKDSDVNFK